jgi:hypothetical protein
VERVLHPIGGRFVGGSASLRQTVEASSLDPCGAEQSGSIRDRSERHRGSPFAAIIDRGGTTASRDAHGCPGLPWD